ncbi:MAG: YihY family inner membrane protein [Gammaproteobacteria bacterium]|nr:YihY family inner membrane protein [Gammaproteobacteria bacterium]
MKRQFKTYFTRPLAIVFHGTVSFVRQVIKQFMFDNCSLRAAALAFTSLLSIVPLMTVSFTVLAAFPFFKHLGAEVQNFIFQNFVATSAEIVQAHLQKFASQAMNLSATGIIFLVVTAVVMVLNMEQAFNAIWHVKSSRNGLTAFMMYWGLITFLPILIGIGFAISSYLFSLPLIGGTAESLGIRKLLLAYFPWLLTFIAFTVLYVTLPNCKVLVRHAAIGGLIATILFEFAKYGFGLYVLNFPTYELLYGTLAAIPIFLVWIYLSWLIILFGAVVAHVAGEDKEAIFIKRKESL